MPFARLTMLPALNPEIAQQLNIDLTSIIAQDLGKRHELTSVLIETPISGTWTIGATDKATSAHLEVCVTAGTNSEDEKRTFVANAMARLRETLPDLNAATYVVVKELAASDWGFDGLTQADRAARKV